MAFDQKSGNPPIFSGIQMQTYLIFWGDYPRGYKY